jgi:hypothetical protein
VDWKTTYTANERLPGSWHVVVVCECPEIGVTVADAFDIDRMPREEDITWMESDMQAEEETKYQAWRESGSEVKYEDWSPAPPVEVFPDKERVFVAVDSKGKESGEFRTKEEAVAAAMTAGSAEVKP